MMRKKVGILADSCADRLEERCNFWLASKEPDFLSGKLKVLDLKYSSCCLYDSERDEFDYSYSVLIYYEEAV